ncbi:MAG: lysylphosphatidylglycerol synthase transmembrane domain-containing protein [Candidatus Saccharimonadales bacterium]
MEEKINPLKQSRWKLYLTIVTFIALVGLVYGLRDQIGGVISNLGQVNALALLLLIPIQILNNDAYARLYRSLFKTLGKTVSYAAMFKMTMELKFVNNIFPSGGISGVSYFSVRARSQNVTASQATLTQVMKFMLVFVSFQPLLVLGLFFLAARGHANDLVMVVASSLITLLIVGTFVGLYILDSKSRISTFLTFVTKGLNKLVHIVRPKYPETISIKRAQASFVELHENYKILKKNWRSLKMPFVYTFFANTTEVAALYVVYLAFGELVNVGAIILAYAVANFAGLISVLPAGIGIYEGLMTAVLVATGIPARLSIPVTVMFRVLTMFIQLVPGYILYSRALNGRGLAAKR